MNNLRKTDIELIKFKDFKNDNPISPEQRKIIDNYVEEILKNINSKFHKVK